MNPPSPARRRMDAATATVFVLALWLPALLGAAGLALTAAPRENRALAPAPLLAWRAEAVTAFPARFDAYFNDHFGLRGTFIRWNNLLRFHVLRVSPVPDVLIGRAGWLFLATAPMLDDMRGGRPFAPRELEAWGRTLAGRQAWLAERGARYLVVIVPDKHAIYPELLGERVPVLSRQRRLDQFVAGLGARLPLLDLRESLLAAKADGPLYYRSDTHWTAQGTYVAYRAIFERLVRSDPRAVPWPLEALRLQPREPAGGDLAGLMGLRERFAEPRAWLLPGPQGRARLLPQGAGERGGALIVSERADASLPQAVLFGDSFAPLLQPLLSEHFRRLAVVVQPYGPAAMFDTALLEKERPRLVIQAFSERELLLPPPPAIPGSAQR